MTLNVFCKIFRHSVEHERETVERLQSKHCRFSLGDAMHSPLPSYPFTQSFHTLVEALITLQELSTPDTLLKSDSQGCRVVFLNISRPQSPPQTAPPDGFK